MNNEDHDATCSCCGGNAAAGMKAVRFETQFQYYGSNPGASRPH